MKLIVAVRYDFDETEDQPVLTRVQELHDRLAGLPNALVWVAIGDSYERVSAAIEAEESP